MTNETKPFSLSELNGIVRSVLEEQMPLRYWVTGELSEVRPTAAGHCYIELVERDEMSGELLAKARGTVWARVYSLLRPYFLEQTGREFSVGLKVLLQVSVNFHELYGYSLDVCDIEPAYTIGDMARRRMLIIKRLTDEGVIDLNKELTFPILPQRIAVISSSAAAGYGDFCDQLKNNPYGFRFYVSLFQSPMQGSKVEEGIISALNAIANNIDNWDVVVIIRGGGATSDLSCFDTYDLANNCAQFPIPLITGIGHHRDDTLLDLVSHTREKTPTAAAELLIHAMIVQGERLAALQRNIPETIMRRLDDERRRLDNISNGFPALAALSLQKHRHRLELWEQKLQSLSPDRTLSRGYALVSLDGRIVKNATQLKNGDNIVIRFSDGFVECVVKKEK